MSVSSEWTDDGTVGCIRGVSGSCCQEELVLGFSAQHIILLLIIALLLFGRGKISELMGDVAKGIKSFKKGMAEEDEQAKPAAPTIDNGASYPDRTKAR